jgi:predicted glycosyltransferase involved in capsule biosynthesis
VKLSILICTFSGRQHLLDLTLLSLEKQVISHKYEIIVIDDGIPEDGVKLICNKHPLLNIRYVFLGQRNINPENRTYWRDAGFALNWGIKNCNSELLLFHEAEIYCLDNKHIEKMITPHLERDKIITHPSKVYIDTGILLNVIKNNIEPSKELLNQIQNFYHAHFHYSLMIRREHMINIGGWDEKYLGQCWTDGNLDNRLRRYGMNYVPVESECIHLYHDRINTPNHKYNQALYDEDEKNQVIIANGNKDWGQNNWKNIF